MDIIKTLDGLIKDVNNNDIDSLDELQRELIYLKSELEAINYSLCCKTLKDKEKLSFKDWKFSKGLRYVSGHTFKDNDGDIYDSDEIEKMYAHYLNL